jgi:anti-sigma regulatory factor (Ser/Thr protein kinase)
MVPVARLFVRAFLAGNPLADDAELITSEYAANAIRHSAAGEGGAIQVCVSALAGVVRVDVTDHAPAEAVPLCPPAAEAGTAREVRTPQVGQASEEDESGRGLLLVDALAYRWGHDGVAGHRTAWAELRLAALEAVAETG